MQEVVMVLCTDLSEKSLDQAIVFVAVPNSAATALVQARKVIQEFDMQLTPIWVSEPMSVADDVYCDNPYVI